MGSEKNRRFAKGPYSASSFTPQFQSFPESETFTISLLCDEEEKSGSLSFPVLLVLSQKRSHLCPNVIRDVSTRLP